tara:strand:- start:612 stop:1049 length:438 start_codon:yes stop_codon:yes gene_type:complete
MYETERDHCFERGNRYPFGFRNYPFYLDYVGNSYYEFKEDDPQIKSSTHQGKFIVSLDGNVKPSAYSNAGCKKIMIAQSIIWAAAILVVAIVDEKQFAILMLVILATVSLMNLKKGTEQALTFSSPRHLPSNDCTVDIIRSNCYV